MKICYKILRAAFLLLPALSPALYAVDTSMNGRLTGWMNLNNESFDDTEIGLRYIPELSLSHTLENDVELSVEAAVRAHAWGPIDQLSDFDDNADADLYRGWLRYATHRFELRGGLQRISFGSSTLLRPLMWFDHIDPRDPLKLTDGVYGLLSRYYFINNASIWLWGLYGNDDTKGHEQIPSDDERIEYGGRVQAPFLTGEIAATYHHRYTDRESPVPEGPLSSKSGFPEDRFGLDGKWDVVVGLWFEAAVVHQQLELSELRYQTSVSTGLDYTFAVGNGLALLCEHYVYEMARNPFDPGDSSSISAVSTRYPLTLIDDIGAIVHYDWQREDWFRYINWQRRYDTWSLHVTAFRNPDEAGNNRDRENAGNFGGTGAQIMLVFDH